jgi:hypothetical protein
LLHVVQTGKVAIEDLPQAEGEGSAFSRGLSNPTYCRRLNGPDKRGREDNAYQIRASLNEIWFRTFFQNEL